MLKILTTGFTLLALTICNSAFAAAELDGRWTVTWPNNSKNIIKLTSGGGLSGIYVNDAGILCPVSGSFVTATGSVTLHVVCPTWDIKMNGIAFQNQTAVNGSYVAYGKATGQFMMVKQIEAGQPNVAERRCVDARQSDSSLWRTCVGDDGRQYCEQCKGTSCSRVTCR